LSRISKKRSRDTNTPFSLNIGSHSASWVVFEKSLRGLPPDANKNYNPKKNKEM
jgi:hypothetical protein